MTTVSLPVTGAGVELYELGRHPAAGVDSGSPPASRIAYAAAHVVGVPGSPSAIDWDATLEVRRRLWATGLGVAEAMDTAQRGGALHPAQARELIAHSAAEAPPGRIVCGITTDDLEGQGHRLADITAAYLAQLEFATHAGAGVVMMASRELAAVAEGPDDYATVYGDVLAQASEPIMIHWLGPMFDPALAGYWGEPDPVRAMDALLHVIADNAGRVSGVKISMLDPELEIEFRRRLPRSTRCYTGDDFNYPRMILGDEQGHSEALLGIFDAIAPIAAPALRALDEGDVDRYLELMNRTVPLSRHVFETPTYRYKTGLAFLAYLCGRQDSFSMLGGHESDRSVVHLAELVRLADRAGLFGDVELAAARIDAFMGSVGVA